MRKGESEVVFSVLSFFFEKNPKNEEEKTKKTIFLTAGMFGHVIEFVDGSQRPRTKGTSCKRERERGRERERKREREKVMRFFFFEVLRRGPLSTLDLERKKKKAKNSPASAAPAQTP
jgi:hypothetical protein